MPAILFAVCLYLMGDAGLLLGYGFCNLAAEEQFRQARVCLGIKLNPVPTLFH